MSWFYRRLLRPCLFTQNAEQIHERTMRALAWAGGHRPVCRLLEGLFGAPQLPVEVFGLKFPNPIGLAAGMDKYAQALPAWPALGFGFTELGAVTWHAQPGNPPPRLFRAIPEEAIINRMGFNNPGAEVFAQRLAGWRARGLWPAHPVGVNLGKSKMTPLEQAPADYANSFRVLLPHLDFFVINVSSPNTPNLRQLQDKSALDEILAAMQEVRRDGARAKPLLVKVAPDLSFEALDQILELVGPRQIDGIVATNTTISRPPAGTARLQAVYAEAGGLSGRPLRARSTVVIRHLYRQTRGSLPIIGVGGIFSVADAWEKIAAGASLLQVYTGFVFEGPAMVKGLVYGLQQRLEQRGLPKLSQAVGISIT
jgi:dihydroorotate dehydrogenase